MKKTMIYTIAAFCMINLLSCSDSASDVGGTGSTGTTLTPQQYTVEIAQSGDDGHFFSDSSGNTDEATITAGYFLSRTAKSFLRFNISDWINGDVTFNIYLYDIVYSESANLEVYIASDIGTINISDWNTETTATLVDSLFSDENFGWKSITISESDISTKKGSNDYITIVLRPINSNEKLYYFRSFDHGSQIPYVQWTQME